MSLSDPESMPLISYGHIPTPVLPHAYTVMKPAILTHYGTTAFTI